MRYEDFVLQLDAGPQGDFRANVLRSPFGEGKTTFTLPFSAAAASAALASHGPDSARSGSVLSRSATALPDAPPPLSPLEVGAGLYRSLFRGPIRSLLDKSRGQLQLESDLCLRLKIKLDPGDPATAELADLPWELLYDDEVEDHFALLRQTTLIRYLDVPRPSAPIPFTSPLRILAVAASPTGLPALDLAEECRRLEELERRESGVEVTFLRRASAGVVRETLAEGEFHILHFMGHGDFDRTSGEGLLYFEQPDGSAERVTGRAFAARLKDLRSLGVVTLNACNTARALHQSGRSPFRGVAAALVLGGIPAVVAMQQPISDLAAIGFSSAFYRQLTRGVLIDTALTEGRQAILSVDPEGFEWAIPVLFLRVPDGKVFVARTVTEAPAVQEAIAPAAPVAGLPPAPSAPPRVEPAEPERKAATPISNLPTAPKNGWPLPKVAGAAGGALVLAVGIYGGVHALSNLGPQAKTGAEGKVDDIVATSEQLTSDPQESHDPPKRPHANGSQGAGPGGDDKTQKVVVDPNQAGDASTHNSGLGGAANGGEGLGGNATPPSPSATADASALKARVVSITPREGGGWRANLSFSNTSPLPLSVVLGDEGCVLSAGAPYLSVDSDLPSVAGGFRLDLPPEGRAQHFLNFPMTKVRVPTLVLSLATDDGRRIPVEDATKILDTTPRQ